MQMEDQEKVTDPRAEAKRLSRLKADELILIDLVTEKSRKVELMPRDELCEAFKEKAALAPEPEVDELLADAEKQMDRTYNRAPGTVSFVPPKTRSKEEREKNRELVPTLRDQREAFTRRELLRSLIAGDLHHAEAVAAEAEKEAAQQAPAEPRDITDEYFNEVLYAVLADDCGVAKLIAWDEKEYYHYRPLLSASYARILSAKTPSNSSATGCANARASIRARFFSELFRTSPSTSRLKRSRKSSRSSPKIRRLTTSSSLNPRSGPCTSIRTGTSTTITRIFWWNTSTSTS